eukprot:11069163-Alexandrium_andersonii.AAC.1
MAMSCRKANRKEARRGHRMGRRHCNSQSTRCIQNDRASQGRGTLVRGSFGNPTSIPKKGCPIVEAQEIRAEADKCDK